MSFCALNIFVCPPLHLSLVCTLRQRGQNRKHYSKQGCLVRFCDSITTFSVLFLSIAWHFLGFLDFKHRAFGKDNRDIAPTASKSFSFCGGLRKIPFLKEVVMHRGRILCALGSWPCLTFKVAFISPPGQERKEE